MQMARNNPNPIKDSLPLLSTIVRVMTKHHHLMCLILDEKEHPLLMCKRVEILNAAGHDVIVNLYGVVIDYENEDPMEFEIKRDSLYELATEWLQKKKASKTVKKK